MQFLEDAPLSGKRVLVRFNADVPMNGELRVVDDYRLRQILPTIHYLVDYGAKVILIGHLGRPGGRVDKDLSLRPIYLYLSAMLKKPIKFAPTLFSTSTKEAVEGLGDGEILGLENLRFDPGEDKNSRTFAAKLAKYGELYVNDAFSVSHREVASVVAITELLPSYAGLSLEREVRLLGDMMKHPERPYIAIVGGAKISDKLPTIKRFIRTADTILVGGGVANTLLKVSGVDVKQSLVDSESLEAAELILKLGKGKVVLPEDFVWEDNKILDLGPKTIQKFSKHIDRAKTIFWSGPLGKVEEKKYAHASLSIVKSIKETCATSVVGGGDTVSFLSRNDIEQGITFLSTGGSATLEFLSGSALPGLTALR